MQPFPFEELQKILELKDTELEIDELLFTSTIFYIEKILGYPLEDHNYNELQTVRDCKVYTKQDNITEMVNIIDIMKKTVLLKSQKTYKIPLIFTEGRPCNERFFDNLRKT